MADHNDDHSTVDAVDTVVLNTLSGVLNEPVEVLRARPVLAVHEWDSVASLEVLSQLENRLSVTLDLRAYHATRTVDDLIGLVTVAVRAHAVG
jgi:acyl carrier protein